MTLFMIHVASQGSESQSRTLIIVELDKFICF